MANAEKKSYPKSLWIAGPNPFQTQHRILIPNENGIGIKATLRFHNGEITVKNEYEEAVVRRAMKNRVWDADLSEPKIHPIHKWVCYSTAAYSAFMESLPPHGDPAAR